MHPLYLVGLIIVINLVVWGVVITIMKLMTKRYGRRPAELEGSEPPDRALEQSPDSYYLETRLDSGRRFPGWGFMMRGNGIFYTGAAGIYFLRYATKEPMYIPYRNIKGIDVGPSGQARTGRLPMMHIHWQYEDMNLTSLIAVSRHEDNTRECADRILGRVKS